ncbi:MAG: ATP-binding protein [Candidatus Aminicenantes bacterium]|nr:ATP-binding protein [Candidatus Aminicenantes bacterium]
MKRFLYKDLLTWKSQDSRKPLLLQGARQVGKTYLLKEFAEREYENCAYFNFEQTPEVGALFESSLDPAVLIESLSAFAGRKIKPGSTLIFFDEIQAFPRAITSLKYFCEEAPGYHVVSAGSLLGVSVGKRAGFPVGKVNFMTLYPMSFLEYLTAVGQDMLLTLLEEKKSAEPLTGVLHEKLIRLFKYYLYIGGMPEVVQSYISNRDIEKVGELQREILQAYERDFSKYSSAAEAINVSDVWRSIPAQLARENKKFKYSDVKKGGRAARFETAIEWLRKAGLIYVVYHIKTPKLPLAGYIDRSKFKIFLLDPGLLCALLDVPPRVIVLGDRLFSEYSGAFTENYVAGELVSSMDSDKIFYWTSKSEAEVDFVFSAEGSIFPLEVKGGLSRRTKSLRVYAQKYQPAEVFRTSPRNFTKDGDLVNIPLYAVSLLPGFGSDAL